MSEIDLRTVAVLGRNRLVIDIVSEAVSDLPHGPAVAILVDPEPEHWDEIDHRPVIAVLSEPTAEDILSAVRRGADAVLGTGDALADLPTAIEIVRAGGVVLDPLHARVVVDAVRAQPAGQIALTRRERDIVESINVGDSVKQTALRLGIAKKTVENLQRGLFRKLDVRNRAQAVARAHELGLLADDAPRVRD